MIYILGLLFILYACEKVTLDSEVMTLEDDFISAEIDGKMVRFSEINELPWVLMF